MDFEANAPTITNQMTMLAIYPPKVVLDHAHDHAQDDVINNGLHMTLVRLGQTDDEQAEQLLQVCKRTASLMDPIELWVEGTGFFNAPDMYVHWLLINGAGLDIWRATYLDILSKVDMLPPQRYGYTPHMTLGYYAKRDGFPQSWETSGITDFDGWCCDTIYLVRGKDEKIPIPIGPPDRSNLPWR